METSEEHVIGAGAWATWELSSVLKDPREFGPSG